MRRIHRYTALALAGLLGASLLLTACDNGKTPDATTPDTMVSGDASDTAPANEVSYKVTVKKSVGTRAHDIIVKATKDGAEIAFKLVGPTGFVTFTLPEDSYTVVVETPAGEPLYVDTDAAVLTPDAPEITLTVLEAAVSTQPLDAPSKHGDYVRQEAALVGEGQTYIPYVSGD